MLGVEVDFERLLAYFSRPHRPVRAYYYTAIPRADVPHNMHNLVRYLDYNGYQTVTKTMRTFTDEYTGEQRHKGNMDIELAVDCLELKDYSTHSSCFPAMEISSRWFMRCNGTARRSALCPAYAPSRQFYQANYTAAPIFLLNLTPSRQTLSARNAPSRPARTARRNQNRPDCRLSGLSNQGRLVSKS